jgi:uncharacterized membrane protein
MQQLSRTCKSCGYIYNDEVYNRLSVYFEIDRELSNLRSFKDDFVSNIEKITGKINQYEDLLFKDIERLTKASPVNIPSVEGIKRSHPAHEKVKLETSDPDKKALWKNLVKKTSKPAADSSEFEIKLGQKWLLIIGIITMVFGVGYFLKYSFEQGWVGPAGRVASAYMWGIIFLVSGDRFRKRNFEIYGLSLVGGGIATLYFSTFAAFNLYHLFTQFPSFFIMVLITMLACVLAIIYDTKWLAILGLIGGFFTPMMLSTGQDNYIFLFTYMTILNLGLLGVAFYKKWDILNILGFVFTYLLYAGWFYGHYAESKFWPAIIYLNIFYFIYSIVPFAYQFFRVIQDNIKRYMIITPNSFFAFGFSYFMIKEHFSLQWVSIITILYSIMFLLMASYLYKKDMHKQDAFAVFLAKSALFLIITIPIVFSQHWITIFWMAQALVLLWAGKRIERKSLIIGSYILVGAALCKFLLYDYAAVFKFSLENLHIRGSYTYLIGERLITSVFILIILFVFAGILKKDSFAHFSISRSSPAISDPAFFYGLFCIVLFIVLNIETSSFFHDYLMNARFASISILWTLFSVALMITGFKVNSSLVRKVSLGLFFFTLIKVFLFDMSRIHTPYRILSFIILGIVMIGTSYLYHRFKNDIIRALSADKKTT